MTDMSRMGSAGAAGSRRKAAISAHDGAATATVVAIAHQVLWCADDVGFEGAEFLGGRIVAIRDPGLRVLGDSRWVKDSKAFLPGPLVLAGLFLRFSDLFVASACPATAHLRREWRQACVFLSFLSGIPASAPVPQSRNDDLRL